MPGEQQCFVCGEALGGDAAFVQHHLNACLDRQGSSTGSSSRAAPTSPPPRDSPQLAADAALALSLAEQEVGLQYDPAFECDRALALSLAQDDSRLDASSCPVCGAGWDERGLALPTAGDDAAAHQRVFNKRENHVRACLEAKTRFEDGDGGGVGGLGMHGVPDVEADEVDGQTGAGSASAVATGKRPWTGDVGGKDEVRGTAGLIYVLRNALKQSNLAPQGRTKEAWLASAATEHIPTRVKDWGWGCGYKNTQMVFSSLRHLPQYAKLFAPAEKHDEDSPSPLAPIPSIREWQEMIEKAWAAGFDPDGASHFGGKLINSRRWIGTTEVYVALTWLGIRVTIIDFPKLAGTSSVHEPLLRWLVNYFRLAPSSVSAPGASPPSPSQPQNAFTALQSAAAAGGPIRLTAREPLYLQHRGHSRTVVGVELGGGKVRRRAGKGVMGGAGAGGEPEREEEEAWLLVHDPGKPLSQELKTAAALAASSSTPSGPILAAQNDMPAPPSKKHKLSPVLGSTARGGFGTGTGTSSAGSPKFGDVLKVVRVNMRELKRRDAYQLLYVDPNEPPLTAQEKLRRKVVRSIVVTT
ncbi:peptidase family C78-domain-containing protein [Rhodotorula diobovata]|uniref:Peptidase family C78-domain-containing protein n=1 Tax=Rhodotorula diobovata TaxID=5288 RepID=A0A5C5G550_9BASI|nr:peptidase family C78-domain-containing protein [Rhodotorula diobovata]